MAGWVLVEETPTSEIAGHTLTGRLVTISDCIQADLPRPDTWLGDWFQDPDQARVARDADAPGASIVTVAMDPRDASAFMGEFTDEVAPWFDLLRTRTSLAPQTRVIGWEVVGAEEYLDLHSWHCHDYAEDASAALEIGLTDRGLLRTADDARRVLTWMLSLPSDDAPEEVPWTVVALAV